MRNLAPKDKNVRLLRVVHTPNVQRLIYEGYGREVSMTHEKAVGAGNGKNQGWTIDHPGWQKQVMKKAHAIAKIVDLLKNGD